MIWAECLKTLLFLSCLFTAMQITAILYDTASTICLILLLLSLSVKP